MTYEVRVTDSADEEARKRFNKPVYTRFLKRLKKLETNPKIYGKPLRFPLAGTWEIYFEHRHRVLFEIDEVKNIVWVTGIRHKDQMS